jgi:hypothetical protein
VLSGPIAFRREENDKPVAVCPRQIRSSNESMPRTDGFAMDDDYLTAKTRTALHEQ